MTSTTSSNKKNFAKLYKWAFKRSKAILIIFSIMMAVGIAIDLYIITVATANADYNHSSLSGENFGILGLASIIMAQVGAGLLAMIAAVNSFSFLHNKRSTDMFGALPATRTTLYFSHLLGGASAIALPYTLGCFIVMAFTTRSLYYFTLNISIVLFGLVGIAAVYAFTALIAYCCGTGRDTTIITLGSNIIYVGVVLIFNVILSAMIPGIDMENFFETPVSVLFTPFGFSYYLDAYVYGGQTSAMWITLIWSLLFIAASVFLGNYAAKTRHAETAQNDFNIKWLPVVIKVGMSVLVGGFAGLATASASEIGFSNMFVFAFWYIIIGFAAFFILHLIFSRGLKGRFIPSFISYLCSTAAVIFFVFLLSTGLGIDTYVPSAMNVNSVKLDDLYDYSDPENIAAITEIHKTIIDGIKEEHSRPYYLGTAHNNDTDYDDSDDYSEYNFYNNYPNVPGSFNVTYNKKLGFATSRTYYINYSNHMYYDIAKIQKLYEKIYNSDEYKKMTNSVLWSEDGAKRQGKLPVSASLTHCYSSNEEGSSEYTRDSQTELSTDEKFIEGLYNALKTDILADKNFYSNKRTTSYDGSYNTRKEYYELYVYYDEPMAEINSYDLYKYHNTYIFVTISPDYSNTIKYLEDNGVNTKSSTADPESF